MVENLINIPKGESKNPVPQSPSNQGNNEQKQVKENNINSVVDKETDTTNNVIENNENKNIDTDNNNKDKDTKKKRKVTRIIGIIIGIILCVVSVPVIIINLFIIIQGLVNPNQVPSVGPATPLIVLTDSMYPTIHGGDLIVVDKSDPQSIKENDVIAYFDPAATSGTAVVTHRVLSSTTSNGQLAWKTKGDANTGEDKLVVTQDKLVGKFGGVRFEGLGSFCMWLKSVPGIIVCVGIPLVLLVGYDIIRRRIYSKKQEKTEDALLAELEELRKKQAN